MSSPPTIRSLAFIIVSFCHCGWRHGARCHGTQPRIAIGVGILFAFGADRVGIAAQLALRALAAVYLRGSAIQPHRSRVEYQGAIAQFATVRLPDGRRPSEFDAVFSTFAFSLPGVTGLPADGLAGQQGPEVAGIRIQLAKGLLE